MAEAKMKRPYYLIDIVQLLKNLEKIDYIRKTADAKCLLALKCFSTWPIFKYMKNFMDGTASSSLFEAQLGHEKFGGETNAYSVAFSADDIEQLVKFSDKIVFNSVSQFNQFEKKTKGLSRGLRINPNFSCSIYPLSDPCRPHSRLGEPRLDVVKSLLPKLSGLLIHNHCDNSDYESFEKSLSVIEEKLGHIISQLEWLNLGGGVNFTFPNFPLERFCKRIKEFSERYGVQIYLEPGQAVVTLAGSLEVTVLDVLEYEKSIAVVNSSTEAHMPELLLYTFNARIYPNMGDYNYIIAGNSCLAGDIFGEYKFPNKLSVGDTISIKNAASYTLVKKNWFNGLKMPSIVIKHPDGRLETIKSFSYQDFLNSQS